MTNTITL